MSAEAVTVDLRWYRVAHEVVRRSKVGGAPILSQRTEPFFLQAESIVHAVSAHVERERAEALSSVTTRMNVFVHDGNKEHEFHVGYTIEILDTEQKVIRCLQNM